MRHAFLISAYNNYSLLLKNIKIYAKYGDVYLHIDKKNPIGENLLTEFRKIENLEIISSYKIYWGSYKHLLAFVDMIRLAREKRAYDFYHILSGNTMIGKDRVYFEDFFASRKNANFIEIIPVDERISERFRYYYFLHRLNYKSRRGKTFSDRLIKLQKKMKISRKCSFAYRGYLYCHLSGAFIDYLSNYLKSNPNYLRTLKTCFIPEEFFFQNVVMNSPFKDTVVNDPLIFDVWQGLSQSPLELTEEYFSDIVSSEKLFFRKIGETSGTLINKITENIHITEK